jgi:hypothetical protein
LALYALEVIDTPRTGREAIDERREEVVNTEDRLAAPESGCDWPVDFGPATNDCGRVEIGIGLITARLAPKLRLRRAIGFFRMSTSTTFPAGVSRVNLHQGYASKGGFVSQEASELRKRPRVQTCPLIAPSPYPRADASQFLNGNPTIRAFGLINDFLRNDVVEVLGKASLFTRELLEVTLGAARTAGLKFTSQLAVTIAHIRHGGAAVGLAVRIGGNLHNPHIDAEKVIHDAFRRIGNITSSRQIEPSSVIDEIRFSLLIFKQRLLTIAGRVGYVLASLHRPDTHRILLESQDSAVVADGPMSREPLLTASVSFIGGCNLRHNPDHDLSTQGKRVPRFAVKERVDSVLAEDPLFPCTLTNPIATFVGCLQCAEQVTMLFPRAVQSDFSRKLQYLNFTRKRKS